MNDITRIDQGEARSADRPSGCSPAASADLAASLGYPPVTTGGSETPSPHFKGIDHLRVCCWGDSAYVRDWIDSWADEQFGVNPADFHASHGRFPWVPGFASRRSSGSWQWKFLGGERSAADVFITEYDGFFHLVVTGGGTITLGQEGCLGLLAAVRAFYDRTAVRRIDTAWDGFGIDPWALYGLLQDGHYRSRCKIQPHFVGSPGQPGMQTVYSVAQPEKKGVERYFRCYDMRGPVRFEAVFKGAWAERLAGDNVLTSASGELREFIDLLDPASNDRHAYRRPLHPAWLAMLGAASRAGSLSRPERLKPEGLALIGSIDGAIQRAAGRLVAGAEAFGMDWVIERLHHHCRAAGGPDLGLVAELRDLRDCAAARGIAGVHPWPESVDSEIPF